MTREIFLERSNKAHNNKFTYPEFNGPINSRAKLPIICPQHGLFHQNPFDHAKGIGCARCHYDSIKEWTKEDDEFLKQNYKSKKSKWCAEQLGKTQCAIRGRAKELGVSTKQKYTHPDIPVGLWSSIVSRSKEKSFQSSEIDFDSDYIAELYKDQNGKCALSGWAINLSRNGLENTVSVDRIDSNKGYTKDNIQLTHKIVNRCKLNLPEELFFQLCKAVYKQKRAICDNATTVWEEDSWLDTDIPRVKYYEFEDEFILKDNKIINIRDL